jgi:CBS domain containing-hemolysin-like protein
MNDDPPLPRGAGAAAAKAEPRQETHEPLFERFLSFWKGQPANSDEAADETADFDDALPQDIAAHERRLISNVEAFRDLRVDDVMVPRAEIDAVEIGTSLPDLLELVVRYTHSRLPVYRETLDDVVGVFHIRDLLPIAMAGTTEFDFMSIIRDMPIVAPSMRTVDLLLEMRRERRHIALVVDEFGGIDGLVTMEDLIEEIVGEIEDEHDRESFTEATEEADGTLLIDARMPIYDFEKYFGDILSEEEREASDTVGGLIWSLAGHIPTKGEIVRHESGAEFEVIDADHRRIKRLRAHKVPGGLFEFSQTSD